MLCSVELVYYHHIFASIPSYKLAVDRWTAIQLSSLTPPYIFSLNRILKRSDSPQSAIPSRSPSLVMKECKASFFRPLDVIRLSRSFFGLGLLQTWAQKIPFVNIVQFVLPFAASYLAVPLKSMNTRAHNLFLTSYKWAYFAAATSSTSSPSP
jgi:hypothetical protein